MSGGKWLKHTGLIEVLTLHIARPAVGLRLASSRVRMRDIFW